MIRTVLLAVLSGMVLLTSALAGEIQGKVSGAAGTSVVYVDAIPGKTFPPPVTTLPDRPEGIDVSAPYSRGARWARRLTSRIAIRCSTICSGHRSMATRNLGTISGPGRKGEKRSFQFDQPGVISLLCNVHPEMSGYLVVSPTPYFAETDGGGSFKISNVPDGKYTVVAWHEGVKQQTRPVEVAGSGAVEFTFPK